MYSPNVAVLDTVCPAPAENCTISLVLPFPLAVLSYLTIVAPEDLLQYKTLEENRVV